MAVPCVCVCVCVCVRERQTDRQTDRDRERQRQRDRDRQRQTETETERMVKTTDVEDVEKGLPTRTCMQMGPERSPGIATVGFVLG